MGDADILLRKGNSHPNPGFLLQLPLVQWSSPLPCPRGAVGNFPLWGWEDQISPGYPNFQAFFETPAAFLQTGKKTAQFLRGTAAF